VSAPPRCLAARRAEVQKQLAELKRKGDEGTRADPTKERQTVAQFMETWLAAARTSTRPQTWNGYERKRIVRLHIVPTLGRTKLGALRPDTIQKIYAEKLTGPAESGKPLTAISVKKITEVLHNALETAVKWGYLARNPATKW
jgi:hypothetical protein